MTSKRLHAVKFSYRIINVQAARPQKIAMKIQMICDRAERFDFRAWLRGWPGKVPENICRDGQIARVTWTETAFGGRRPWLLCPTCERRCAVLYRARKNTPWGCHVCRDVRYRSEVLSPVERRRLKAVKLRQRLGQVDANLTRPFPAKPRFMRWHTYTGIRAKAVAEEQALFQAYATTLPSGKRG